ncbi:hypothetical protein QBC40DRAFT_166933 [Triangularia verruculosa]|uniref:Uncharacterized protein n=1 Tax=Triangularia verruculosa TaxID=2587418 RepID=A0AAN7AXM5_9PEZI|nr:hypothetical protein QBC40DRAFT_166933 [Triangularia verruculosa]
MVSKIFYAVGAVLAQLAQGAAVAPIANYAVSKVQWDLPIDPNVPTGPREAVTGTVQEAITQMELSYPGWTQNFTAGLNLTDPDPEPAFKFATQADRQSTNCDFDSDKGKAFCQDIRDGSRYLGRIDSPAPKNQPKSCGRVSCAYNSAIWWCNNVCLLPPLCFRFKLIAVSSSF